MNHRWLSGETATDHNLIPEIRAMRARSRFRRVIEKIKLQGRIQKLREQEDDPDNSDLSEIFREIALAKVADEKEEQEVLRVTEKVTSEAKRRSFQA